MIVHTVIYTRYYYWWSKTIPISTFNKEVYMQWLIWKMSTKTAKLFRPLMYGIIIGEHSTYSRNLWWQLKWNCIDKPENNPKFLLPYKSTDYVAEYVNSTKSDDWTKKWINSTGYFYMKEFQSRKDKKDFAWTNEYHIKYFAIGT